MLLGEMLMVKTGVNDRQQAPPSYPFTVLSKDAGLARIKLLDQELHNNVMPYKNYKQILSLELNMLVFRNFTTSLSNVGLLAFTLIQASARQCSWIDTFCLLWFSSNFLGVFKCF
jgi:hypothetical protein